MVVYNNINRGVAAAVDAHIRIPDLDHCYERHWKKPSEVIGEWWEWNIILHQNNRGYQLWQNWKTFIFYWCLSVYSGHSFLKAYTAMIIVLNGHYGVYLGPCRRIFQNFHFYPFFGWKTVKKWPKNDIFALSAGAFFPEATYRHVYGIKW